MATQSINYSLYTVADAGEMSRLLGEVFAERDPPAVAVGLTAAEFEAFVRLYGPKAEAEELTVVARSATWSARYLPKTPVPSHQPALSN